MASLPARRRLKRRLPFFSGSGNGGWKALGFQSARTDPNKIFKAQWQGVQPWPHSIKHMRGEAVKVEVIENPNRTAEEDRVTALRIREIYRQFYERLAAREAAEEKKSPPRRVAADKCPPFHTE
jgi:hypothetical protein